MRKPRIGVLLSGCGVMDGSEIHETVCVLLGIAHAGGEAICIAPDKPQMHVVDHRAGSPTGEGRNVLVESARISRGEIREIRKVDADQLDALILPGGYGAAKNLCDFATAGVDCEVDPEVERLLLSMHTAKKPIGALCIAPAILARVFGKAGVRIEVTIGNDADTAAKIVEMGAQHVQRRVEEVHVDSANRIVTTPAYMIGPGIAEVSRGIDACVREVIALAG